MVRRTVITAGIAWLALPETAAGAPASVEFRVFRNGRDIGRHLMTFTRAGEDLLVAIDVELAVGFGPITFYRYRHENRERWRAGSFRHFASRTDDNGTTYAVEAEATSGRIAVRGHEGSYTAPAEAWPTTYWYPGFLDRRVWVDTQFGKLRRAQVVPAGQGLVPVAGREVSARRFRLEGDLALELWYRDGRWVGLEANAPDGSRLVYRLVSEPPLELAQAG